MPFIWRGPAGRKAAVQPAEHMRRCFHRRITRSPQMRMPPMTQRQEFLLGACAALLPLPLMAQVAPSTSVR